MAGKTAQTQDGTSARGAGVQAVRGAGGDAIVGAHAEGEGAAAAGVRTEGESAVMPGAPFERLAQALAISAQHKRLRARHRPARADARMGTGVPGWTQAAAASPAQRVGMQAEDQVCRYLQSQGVRILARNAHTRRGEIDIVCVDAGVLAFVEVRRRGLSRYGGAAASVGRAKQQRIVRAAQVWLPRLVDQYFGGHPPPCRFDMVALDGDAMTWLKQAFVMED